MKSRGYLGYIFAAKIKSTEIMSQQCNLKRSSIIQSSFLTSYRPLVNYMYKKERKIVNKSESAVLNRLPFVLGLLVCFIHSSLLVTNLWGKISFLRISGRG